MFLKIDPQTEIGYLMKTEKIITICPFKAPIVIRVEQPNNILIGQQQGPQMVQTMQNCTTQCPHLNFDYEGLTETTIRLINKIDINDFEGLLPSEIAEIKKVIKARQEAETDIEKYSKLISESLYLSKRKPTKVLISCASYTEIEL